MSVEITSLGYRVSLMHSYTGKFKGCLVLQALKSFLAFSHYASTVKKIKKVRVLRFDSLDLNGFRARDKFFKEDRIFISTSFYQKLYFVGYYFITIIGKVSVSFIKNMCQAASFDLGTVVPFTRLNLQVPPFFLLSGGTKICIIFYPRSETESIFTSHHVSPLCR